MSIYAKNTADKEPTQQKHQWNLYENTQTQLLQFNCLKETQLRYQIYMIWGWY
jgi:hypothetical protein